MSRLVYSILFYSTLQISVKFEPQFFVQLKLVGVSNSIAKVYTLREGMVCRMFTKVNIKYGLDIIYYKTKLIYKQNTVYVI